MGNRLTSKLGLSPRSKQNSAAPTAVADTSAPQETTPAPATDVTAKTAPESPAPPKITITSGPVTSKPSTTSQSPRRPVPAAPGQAPPSASVEMPKSVVISLRQPPYSVLAANDICNKPLEFSYERDNDKKLVLSESELNTLLTQLSTKISTSDSVSATEIASAIKVCSKIPSCSFADLQTALTTEIPSLIAKGQWATGKDESKISTSSNDAFLDAIVWGALRSNQVFCKQVKPDEEIPASTVTKLFGGNADSAKIVGEFFNSYNATKFATDVSALVQDAKTTSKPAKDQGNFNINLEGAKMGQVVTRFPPEPSGYLHIGHAKAVLLNDYFAKEYKGKLIVRFDDTNPSKEKMEFEDAIKEDLLLLGVKADEVTYTSDSFDKIYDYALILIKKGLAYVDDTDVDTMRQQRFDGIESPHRNQSIEEALNLFTNEMIPGTEKGVKCVLRAKIDMTNKNKALRDPVIYRCNANSHHRAGDKWKCYPTYDFACPIVDALEGVTHALRTIEYRDRNPQYEWFLKNLDLRHVFIWDYSRMNFVYTLLSKRKLTWFVNEGLVTGWDDPRFPTIRGIRRRGLTIDALRQYILMQGASQRNIELEWDKLWSLNKRVIDPVSPRYTALESGNIVKVIVTGGMEDFTPEVKQMPKHKKNKDVGLKDVAFNKEFFLEQQDAQSLSQNEEVTLMDWGNFIVEEIIRSDAGIVTEIRGRLNLKGDFKTTEKKLTWLATPLEGKEDETKTVGVQLLDYDYLISKAKLMEEDDVKDFVTPKSEFVVSAIGDANLRKLAKGDIIQLERKGYYICDKAFGAEASVVKVADASEKEAAEALKDTDKVYLIRIPDGKVASIQSKADDTKDAKAPSKKKEANKAQGNKEGGKAKNAGKKQESGSAPINMYESESLQPELNFDPAKEGGKMYIAEPIYTKEELQGPMVADGKPATEKSPKKKGGAAVADGGAAKKEKKEKREKKAAPATTAATEPEQSIVSKIDICVGKIVEVSRHPDAETLYIEKIDVGEAEPRTIISGLVKFMTPEEMKDKLILVVRNLKPVKMRGVVSYGMVLCASNADHTAVEFLVPPEGSQPGDKVFFRGHEGEPEAQMNPKKKIFETAAAKFLTREDLVAEWDGVPFETSHGVVRASTLAGAHIS